MVNKIIILCLVLCNSLLFGQVTINEGSEITRVMKAYKEASIANEYIDGWRIVIINTNDRREMESARAKFAAMYSYIKMHWEHALPYYKIKVGAYKTKLELESFLRTLKPDFPRAIPIRSRISKSAFNY
jgi:hypothetical protein